MIEVSQKHIPYTSALDVEIESRLLREGYHLDRVSVNKEHVLDIYMNDDGEKFVLGKDNTTGFLIAENQS